MPYMQKQWNNLCTMFFHKHAQMFQKYTQYFLIELDIA